MMLKDINPMKCRLIRRSQKRPCILPSCLGMTFSLPNEARRLADSEGGFVESTPIPSLTLKQHLPYSIQGTAAKLVSVPPAYFLKETIVLVRKRGGPRTDPLRSLIRDYWRRERGPPRGFKWLARKLTGDFFYQSSASSSGSAFIILLQRHALEVARAATPGSRSLQDL
ncbi:hypothetical protein TNCV_1558761 [Trichonephila clavipes]|nr:hypothetical protein TNCV_1558761 [Trichonephila clavipes]